MSTWIYTKPLVNTYLTSCDKKVPSRIFKVCGYFLSSSCLNMHYDAFFLMWSHTGQSYNVWLATPRTKKQERMGLGTFKPTHTHQYLYCNSLGLHNLKLQLLLYWQYSYSPVAPSVGILQYYSPTVSNLTFFIYKFVLNC